MQLHLDWNTTKWEVAFPFVIWFIWKRRNLWVFSRENVKSTECLHKASSAISEFSSITLKASLSSTNQTPNQNPVMQWSPPPPGFTKLNMDAAWKQESLLAGLAGVARNSQGQWIMGFKSKAMADSSLMAELLAIRHGLQLVAQQGWERVILISDCKEAVNVVNSTYKISGSYINLILYLTAGYWWVNSQTRAFGSRVDVLMDWQIWWPVTRNVREEQIETEGFTVMQQPENYCAQMYLSELQHTLDVSLYNFDENVP